MLFAKEQRNLKSRLDINEESKIENNKEKK